MMQDDNPYEGYDTGRRSFSADDLGYPARKRKNILKNPIVAAAILMVSAGVFTAILMLGSSDTTSEDVLPVVQADSGPMKVAPDEPGGMTIPNQDSTLFAELDGKAPPPANVENLLAQTETEIAAAEEAVKDAVAAVEKSVVEEAPKKPETLHAAGSSPETLAFVKSVLENKNQLDEKETAEKLAAQADEALGKPKSPQPTVNDVISAVTKAEPSEAAASHAAKAEPSAGASVTAAEVNSAGTHFVQLSSIRDPAEAPKEWAKLQAKYGDILAGTPYRVQAKDLGAKGVFHRIQAGPFVKTVASAKCDAVKAASGGCFLVAK